MVINHDAETLQQHHQWSGDYVLNCVLTHHKVFGFRLARLQLGHWFVLESIESPIVHQTEMTLDDYIVAAFVCSDDHRASAINVRSRLVGVAAWWFSWRLRKLDPVKECEKLNDYFAEQNRSPQVHSDGTSSSAGAPWHWSMLTFLMAELHMSIKEAKDTPVATAFALWAANAERTGNAKVADGYRLQVFRDEVRKLKEKQSA